jgi:hypothetical protein
MDHLDDPDRIRDLDARLQLRRQCRAGQRGRRRQRERLGFSELRMSAMGDARFIAAWITICATFVRRDRK